MLLAPLRVAILGNDAVLEARPATPTQLAQACLRASFDLVVPASWGEELLAHQYAESLGPYNGPPPVLGHCPIVAQALGDHPDRVLLALAPPPIATARYLRRVFGPRPLVITYAGRCPGAIGPELDAVVAPDRLLTILNDAGLSPASQSELYQSMVPPDRGRYASQPGGSPNESFLLRESGVTLREVSPAALDVASQGIAAHERVAVDCGRLAGCVCAAQAQAVVAQEPPRRKEPVVARVDLDLSAAALRTASA
ncbi:MAG: hypothetical protein ACT4P6_04775 [Gemmatimonadaceae bacterium]